MEHTIQYRQVGDYYISMTSVHLWKGLVHQRKYSRHRKGVGCIYSIPDRQHP